MSPEDHSPRPLSTAGPAAEPRGQVVDQALLSDDLVPAFASTTPPRAGSPFAIDPPAARRRRAAAAAMSADSGAWQVTAGGALLAAAMLVAFAVAAIWSFPAGTAMTAGLGGVMSLLGLSSLYPRLAFGLLVTHLVLFLLAFAQMA